MTEVPDAPTPLKDRPYPPSWIDRAISWIDGLPGAPWLFYLGLALLMAFAYNGMLWLDGMVALGTFHPLATFFGIFTVFWLALYHYLTGQGTRALRAFSPLLDADENQLSRFQRQLGTLPRWLGWLSFLVGIVLAISERQDTADVYAGLVPNTMLPAVSDFVIITFLGAAFFCVVLRSLRQLRMVGQLHASADRIDLLKLEPAHAFSSLTARTGIGLILVMAAAMAIDPTRQMGPLDLITYLATAVLAVAAFVLPIIGIRRHIEAKKQQRLDELADLMKLAERRLQQQVESDRYQDVSSTASAIEAIIRQRRYVQAVSSWPWNPGTLRGFASALLLPILLWLITQLLERFLW